MKIKEKLSELAIEFSELVCASQILEEVLKYNQENKEISHIIQASKDLNCRAFKLQEKFDKFHCELLLEETLNKHI